MKKLFQNPAFNLSFFSMVTIFFFLNMVPHKKGPSAIQLSVITTDIGFPFVAYREIVASSYGTYINWSGLIANISTALICSFVVGIATKYICLK